MAQDYTLSKAKTDTLNYNPYKKWKTTKAKGVYDSSSGSGKKIATVGSGVTVTASKSKSGNGGVWLYITYKVKIGKLEKTISGWVFNNQWTDLTPIISKTTNKESTGTTTGKKNESTASSVSNKTNKTTIQTTTTTTTKDEIDYNTRTEKISSLSNISSRDLGDLIIKDCRGIHGMPYQFLETVDRRLNGSDFGRKYAERIVARMPLLLMTPGEPNYLTGFAAQEKKNMLDKLLDYGNDALNSLEDMLNQDDAGRYFTLDFAYADYYRYVNSMCRMAARFLDIGAYEIPERGKTKTKLINYDWSYHTNDRLPGVLSSNEYVAFYVDSETSISESFSNSTTESILSSKLKEGSAMANELKFIMGTYGSNLDSSLIDQSTLESLKNDFQSFIDSTPLTNNRLMKRIIGDVQTVVGGAKIIFPEIWSDSSFTKSYDINLKLRTPDCDKVSWYLNIFVPMAHAICLCAPRQVIVGNKTNPNAYSAPFLVRAFYKGILSVDMGIITNMSITKGTNSAWTADGLPTQVDISFSIKDLYDAVLPMNPYIGRSSWAIMKNTAMTDYIANTCGVNVNKPDIKRMVDLWAMQLYNRVADIPRQSWMQVEQSMASSLSTFLRDGAITF